jgi:hypothetical protein
LAVWSPFLFFEEMHFKSSIATVNQNKKQVYTEQEEVRLPPSILAERKYYYV